MHRWLGPVRTHAVYPVQLVELIQHDTRRGWRWWRTGHGQVAAVHDHGGPGVLADERGCALAQVSFDEFGVVQRAAKRQPAEANDQQQWHQPALGLELGLAATRR